MIEQQHKVDLYEREQEIKAEMLTLNGLVSRGNLLQIHTRLKAQYTINKLDSQCVKVTEKLHHYRKELDAVQYELEQIRLHAESGMKFCHRCWSNHPANKEYFYADKRNADGLRHICKVCYHKPKDAQVNGAA